MTIINSDEAEKEAVLNVAKLMALSARTAPKTRGVDSVKTLILHEKDELAKLADAMDAIYKEEPERLLFFHRNAGEIRESTMAVLVIGVTGEPKKIESPLDCGGCGMNCLAMQNAKKIDRGTGRGPMCLMQGIDLGIALGSAVKMASDCNTDNRMMYTIGAAARKLELMEADLAVGIPLSASGKNVYFTPK